MVSNVETMSFSLKFEKGIAVLRNKRPRKTKRLRRSSRPTMSDRYSEQDEQRQEKHLFSPLTVDPSANFTTSTFSMPSTSSLERRPISLESSESSTSSSPTCSMVVDLTTEEDDVVDLTSPTRTSVESESITIISEGLATAHHTETRSTTRRRERSEPDDVVIIQESDDEEHVAKQTNRHRTPKSKTHFSSTPHSLVIQSSPPKPNKQIQASLSPPINLSSKRMITCPICMDTAQQFEASGRQTVVTVCGHIFCNVCIRNAISTQHKCPTCRKKLSLRQYHPIFL